MKKVLFYAMTKEKSCFQHILLNAIDLSERGVDAKIIFEGASVTLVPIFEKESHPLYLRAKEKGLIVGICKACSKMLNVLDENEKFGLPILSDMNGHAALAPFIACDYQIISM